MFKLRVSVTFVNLRIVCALFGPGISVLTIGPSGSPGKSDGSLLLSIGAACEAAAVAYALLCTALEALLAKHREDLEIPALSAAIATTNLERLLIGLTIDCGSDCRLLYLRDYDCTRKIGIACLEQEGNLNQMSELSVPKMSRRSRAPPNFPC